MLSNLQAIEVRSFKWPHRPTTVAVACLLGEDTYGRWLGVAKGDPWWAADGSRSGVFETSLVKVIPRGTFWTACFGPVDPIVDVDIVLPVRWVDAVVEEVDLELDVVRFADGSVRVRDQEEFDLVREVWSMPTDIIAQAQETCSWISELVEMGGEPFRNAGPTWLSHFLSMAEGAQL